jgi:AcrR family transcriptional regulator
MDASERKPSNGERRTERRAEKRLLILDGAVRVFAEKGFFNTTVAEIGEPSAAEALRKICVVHLAAVEDNPSLAAVLIVELRQSNAFVRDVEKPRLSEYLDLIGDIVKRGQATGEIRSDVHPGSVKRALFGALDEIALGWLLARRKFELSRTGREMADMFVRGLSASPAAAPVTAPANGAQ